ncbi:MAG: hypothetical protein GY854_17920 [Deltaproteobacteria bacterium]|nr:hypothetical protein [Deltaproteobacteria bacterium]
MRREPPRQRTLRSLRRRDRAEALNTLKEAEATLVKIEAEIAEVARRVVSLSASLNSPPGETSLTAGRLRMDALRLEHERNELQRLTKREATLSKDKRAAAERLDEARDAAAKAVKALAVLENKTD